METINRIDKYRLLANKLRKSVLKNLSTGSNDEIKLVVVRFTQAKLLKDSVDADVQLNLLKSFSLNKYLDLIAHESGHDNWTSLSEAVKTQDTNDTDESTELYRVGVSEFNFNIWCPSYADAKEYLDTHKGHYLLQYKGHYFLARASHIEGLGLSPTDQDWEKIGWNWAQPKDLEAKARLRYKLKQARELLER